MKIILTENQFNSLLQTEGVAQLLQESLRDSKNFEKLIKTVKHLLTIGVAVTSIIAAINKTDLPTNEKQFLVNMVAEAQAMAEKAKADSVYQDKVNACRSYMEYALTNQGYSMKSTGLKPETLVDVSMETGFDLPFLMAVAHQESCFGATPRAKRTNSVFSEGSYDDGRNVTTYDDPNDSVMGYVELLNRSYMVNGKTLFDLLKPGAFVNGAGNRYAQDRNYEGKIKNLRNRIIKRHPELV